MNDHCIICGQELSGDILSEILTGIYRDHFCYNCENFVVQTPEYEEYLKEKEEVQKHGA